MPADKARLSIVLITGASKGIGFETARQLAQAGWRVVIGARNPAAGGAAAAAITKIGGSAAFLSIDISDSASIRQAAADFAKLSPALNVLINNAAIYPDEGLSILTIPRDRLMATFQTNTFGAVEVTQAFLPYLRKAAGARVINVSSGYGQIEGLSAQVPSYCLSKLTLNGVTLMLHQALNGEGIAVNSMCPGWVRTDMGGPSAPRSVEEGADTAVWLASEAPQSLSGKLLRDRKVVEW
jgi:NAD(P)-dependent dehydrogenase (short-subunit alcohol dehydrogenase family)